MYVKFWGTRGSLPTPQTEESIRHKLRQALKGAAGLDLSRSEVVEHYLAQLPPDIQGSAGGNTACVEVHAGDQIIVFDAGSGIRLLGNDMLRRGVANGNLSLDLFFSHTHWDHIQGFPFFAPAFVPGNRIRLHSPLPDLEARLHQQQAAPFFPVPLSYMRASLSFHSLPVEQWSQVGGVRVYPLPLEHPGGSFAYRIEDGTTCMVYATDGEYKRLDVAMTENYRAFFEGADLLVFDAQYSISEVVSYADWGHSSALVGAEFACRAGVRRLVLFHHDPTSSDEKIWNTRNQASAYLESHRWCRGTCDVLVGYDGLELTIAPEPEPEPQPA